MNKEKKIFEVLKEFEQTDYRRGGNSIAPENYAEVSRRINNLFERKSDAALVVDELNTLIWGNEAENEENLHLSFEYYYNSLYEKIKYNGIELWSSEDELRDFSEEKQEYEDLFEFCKKEFFRMTEKMVNLSNLINEKSNL